MGVYAPATGTIPEKKSFLELVFSTREHLQKVNACKVIMGGDFNSTIGSLDPYMRDFESNIPHVPNAE